MHIGFLPAGALTVAVSALDLLFDNRPFAVVVAVDGFSIIWKRGLLNRLFSVRDEGLYMHSQIPERRQILFWNAISEIPVNYPALPDSFTDLRVLGSSVSYCDTGNVDKDLFDNSIIVLTP